MILLVGLTLIAGIILWTFRIYTPPAPPIITFQVHSGGSNPVWGDPTDCQPQGYQLSQYPLSAAQITTWDRAWDSQCDPANPPYTGNYSAMNTTAVVIATHSPATLPLSDITFTFECNGNYAPSPYTENKITVLLTGSLDLMTWFPGSGPPPSSSSAPTLGYCGGFDASGYGGGAFGVLYNRLGIFTPLQQNVSVLENGDTLLLYIHNGGWPTDFYCVLIQAGEFGGDTTDCPIWSASEPASDWAVPIIDYDDYHGAPPWCFTAMNACTILLTYTGNPYTVLATIPVYSLAPPSSH